MPLSFSVGLGIVSVAESPAVTTTLGSPSWLAVGAVTSTAVIVSAPASGLVARVRRLRPVRSGQVQREEPGAVRPVSGKSDPKVYLLAELAAMSSLIPSPCMSCLLTKRALIP